MPIGFISRDQLSIRVASVHDGQASSAVIGGVEDPSLGTGRLGNGNVRSHDVLERDGHSLSRCWNERADRDRELKAVRGVSLAAPVVASGVTSSHSCGPGPQHRPEAEKSLEFAALGDCRKPMKGALRGAGAHS